ncbi:MAG: acyl-ACP thioesterase [Oscillospiraceae bacterium]|nr:acyl-ACP thioesterase [Oscillospiraceae bacterium]
MFYEYTCKVSARDTGLYGQCRPSGVLALLQEAATGAACALHISGPELFEQYNALWMVARMWYHLDHPICWGDTVFIRTWHRGGCGAVLYRDFDLFIGDKQVGEAVSSWVLVDASTRKLLRTSKIIANDTTGGTLCKSKLLSKLRLPEELEPAGQRAFHYSDADINGHVNNVKYADAITDAVHLESLLPGHYVSELQIGYLAECRVGESISLSTCNKDGAWYVHGADETGVSRFDGWLTLSAIPQKSP